MATVRVNTHTLNLRAGPGTQDAILAQLPWDFRVEKLRDSDDRKWIEVRLPDGRTGWLSAAYVAPAPGGTAQPAAAGGPPYGKHSALDSDPPWMKRAWAEYGQAEVPGVNDNPRIEEYHACCTLRATSDEVPWCSSFVNWCMDQADTPGTRLANARSWLEWGRRVEQPRRGDVVVLKRGSNPAQGHVGFYVGSEGDNILVLGGNQGNQVRVSPYARSRVLGYFEPAPA